jgi:lipopolysaccharide/colanic/teichoic acid biosynthesis glycosyltransferase
MHPYAEYLHDFLATHFGYESNGKLKNDFRKPKWAKFLRATWLDELPQLINVLKGEMGLVGVRAFSDEYLKNYPDELKKERAKYKPGCIPTYISLNLDNGHEDRIKSEYIYFKDKEKHPFLTDIRYFFKAVFNILTRKIKTG